MTDHEILETLLSKIDGLTGTVTGMDKRFDGIDKRLDGMDKRFDNLDKRVDDLSDTVAKVAVTQENLVLPRLGTLAEGHSAINEKLIPRSRFDQMQEEIDFLKSVVKMTTQQINDLKSAM